MILKISGNVELNRSYAQTLCMLFFPGAKFAEDEEITRETPIVEVSIAEDESGVAASAKMTVGDKSTSGEYREEFGKFTRERSEKIAVGAAVFNAGKAFFGKTPPWGILTGVRPTKLAGELAGRGLSMTGVKRALTSEYFVNPKKAALAAEVAATERRLIASARPDGCSVYISIPFCPSRCAYCSFVSYSTKRLLSLIPEYLERLENELERTFSLISELGFHPETVYIGGGTPTVLDVEQLDSLLRTVSRCTDVSALREFTLEAGRPDTVTAGKLDCARTNGVTRVSVNPQTLDDEVLESIGRRHTAEDFFRAYELARASGIQTVNTDLIAGLPGCGYLSFSSTVDTVLRLRPENVTFHTFCVKKSAELLKDKEKLFTYVGGGGEAGKCVDYAQLMAKNAGYLPYYMYRQKNSVGNFENVGYSLPGHEGLYNIYIMEEIHSIFAVGAGAVTKTVADGGRRIERFAAPKYPFEYLTFCSDKAAVDGYFKRIKKFFGKETDEK